MSIPAPMSAPRLRSVSVTIQPIKRRTSSIDEPTAGPAPSVLVRATGSAMLLSITLSATQLEQALRGGVGDGSNRHPAQHREIGDDGCAGG
jgi:hypothetical protein